MQDGRPSETALLSALMRAMHPLIDPAPPIFVDKLAPKLCSKAYKKSLFEAHHDFEEKLAQFGSPELVQDWLLTSRLSLAVRARYAEEQLRLAMKRGVSQYVILGAGYDSFPYDGLKSAPGLKVFAVDHPASQQALQARLRELSVEISSDVFHVEIDFKWQSLMEALRVSGYQRDKPAFFSFIGVTMYLEDDANKRIFKEIAADAAPGSELVVDYLLPETSLDPLGQQILRMTEAIVAERGEPGNNYFKPDRLAQLLKDTGFAQVFNFDHEQANARYFSGREDKLQFPKQLYLARALVQQAR